MLLTFDLVSQRRVRVKELVRVLRRNGVRIPPNARKQELVNLCVKQRIARRFVCQARKCLRQNGKVSACRKLQSWWRVRSRLIPRNTKEPFTLETWRERGHATDQRPNFTLVLPQCFAHRYDAESLYIHIHSNKAPLEPLSRRKLNATELRRLDSVIPWQLLSCHGSSAKLLDDAAYSTQRDAARHIGELEVFMENELTSICAQINETMAKVMAVADLDEVNVILQEVGDIIATLESTLVQFALISATGCTSFVSNRIKDVQMDIQRLCGHDDSAILCLGPRLTLDLFSRFIGRLSAAIAQSESGVLQIGSMQFCNITLCIEECSDEDEHPE